MVKIYKNETRDRINKMFDECDRKASDENDGCSWPCSECRLSDRYEKESGIRIEDLEE